MRAMKRRALTLALVATSAVLWSGCEGKKATEYVAGVSTQVQVPKDLKTIRIDINVQGVPVFCNAYSVYDGRVNLPRSLGSFLTKDGEAGAAVSITVVGYTKSATDLAIDQELQCGVAVKPGTTSRVLRRSRQPYVRDRILFLPMALRFSCFDKDCETAGQDLTCKGGRCVDARTDETKLVDFDPDLVDGTGGNCFNATLCMAGAAPPVLVDANDCTYALPNTASAPKVLDGLPPNPITTNGDGVNVAIVYDGGYTRELVDKDPDEGFSIPDPAKPQQFRLAPGLCDMLKGLDPQGVATPHRVTGVFASGTCRPKSPNEPLCKGDQFEAMGLTTEGIAKSAPPDIECKPTPLSPPSSSLLVLADNTANSQNFFNDVGGAAVSLADPAFSKTQLGLMFYPGTGSCGGNPRAFVPEVPLELARNAQAKVVSAFTTAFAALRPLGTPNDLDGALTGAYSLLKARPNDYRRAVLLLGNRGFDQTTCGGGAPDAQAAAAMLGVPVKTYVVMLTGDADTSAPDPVPTANALAVAGGTSQAYDARLKSNQAEAQRAFRDVVNELATCVYDVPTALKDDQVLSYSDPVGNRTLTISHDAACNGPGAGGNGWGADGAGRIYVCGQSCTDYRGVLQTAAAYAQQYLKPALAVPMFAHEAKCKP
jgi:hypothetical protein